MRGDDHSGNCEMCVYLSVNFYDSPLLYHLRVGGKCVKAPELEISFTFYCRCVTFHMCAVLCGGNSL